MCSSRARLLLYALVFQVLEKYARGDILDLEGFGLFYAGCTAPRCPKTPCFSPGYGSDDHNRLCPGGCFVQQGEKWVRCPRQCALEQLCVEEDNIEPYLIAYCEESEDGDKEAWERTFYDIPDIVQCGARGDTIRKAQNTDDIAQDGDAPDDSPTDTIDIECEMEMLGDDIRVNCVGGR